MRKWMFLLFVVLLGADIASKALARSYIPMMGPADYAYPFGGIGLLSDFFGITLSLNYVINTGAAWGFFSGHSGLLFILRSAMIVGMISYLLFSQWKTTPKFPLWLVVVGALGNAIDYCVYGYVVDFIHFTFWGHSFPLFNVADSCITIGVLSLLLFSKSGKKQLQKS